jgi:hypothetical protein
MKIGENAAKLLMTRRLWRAARPNFLGSLTCKTGDDPIPTFYMIASRCTKSTKNPSLGKNLQYNKKR